MADTRPRFYNPIKKTMVLVGSSTHKALCVKIRRGEIPHTGIPECPKLKTRGRKLGTKMTKKIKEKTIKIKIKKEPNTIKVKIKKEPKTMKIKIKKEPKTIKIKIKKEKKNIKIKIKKEVKFEPLMEKLKPVEVQKPIAPVKAIKAKKTIQSNVLEKFKKLKKNKVEKKVCEKEEWEETDVKDYFFNSKNKLVKFRNVVYNPFSRQQFARMIEALLSHEEGVAEPKKFKMLKSAVNESKRAIVRILNNMNSERLI
jgi:hypothetical protein